MEGENLLSGGEKQLCEIKENLMDLHDYKSRYESLVQDENRLGKCIQGLEKEIAEEIISTNKKRRQEIENTYDGQIDKLRARIKKTKEKRDRSKEEKVWKRINEETAACKEENKQLTLEIKTYSRQKGVPAICMTKLYHSIYFPKKIADYSILFCSLLITLLVIPCSIYLFLLSKPKEIYLILIYFVTTVLFFVIYFLFGNYVKDKYIAEILWIKEARFRVRENNKKIAAIKKSIMRDADESYYELEDYDEELERLEKEAADISEQIKEALTVFDNTTRHVIARDIKGRNEEKLTVLKTDYERTGKEIEETEEKIKALTLKIANEYEPFIGRDFMKYERLDTLIDIMKAESVETISEAIALYKQNENEAKGK